MSTQTETLKGYDFCLPHHALELLSVSPPDGVCLFWKELARKDLAKKFIRKLNTSTLLKVSTPIQEKLTKLHQEGYGVLLGYNGAIYPKCTPITTGVAVFWVLLTEKQYEEVCNSWMDASPEKQELLKEYKEVEKYLDERF